MNNNLIKFQGKVADDHGLSNVVFQYTIKKSVGNTIHKSITVPGILGTSSAYTMSFDISRLPLELNDRLTYFFTVYDNDGIHGPKATRSQIYVYKSPSFASLNQERNASKSEEKKDLNELLQQAQNFNNRMQQFRNSLANSNTISWQQKQVANSLQKQRADLENKINELKKRIQNSFDKKNKLSPLDKELLEKQKTLQKLLDSLMDKDLKNLLDKIQKALNKQNKNVVDMVKTGEKKTEDIQKQLERTMDLLKKMDVDERAQDLEKSLLKLADQQDSLNKAYNNGLKKDDALNKQNQINKSFDKQKQNLDSLLHKNSDLNRPNNLNGLDSTAERTKSQLQQAKQNLGEGKHKKSSKNQQQASQQMKQMAAQLQAQMQSSEAKQQSEDLKSMRSLEENLLRLSFSQENIMDDFNNVGSYDPSYTKLGRKQQEIIENYAPVKDSLLALAKRVPKVASFIDQETGAIDKQFDAIPELIGERKRNGLNTKQHFAMTSFNVLALFINEAIKNGQQKMRGMGMGSGSCQTPGGMGKSGKEGMSQTLDQLKKMLQQQLKSLQKGNNPGGTKPGNLPGYGQHGGNKYLLPIKSEQAAKMAAQMAEIQRKLQDIKQQLNQNGSGTGNQLNQLLQQIKDQQKELINKNWTPELIKRQKQILTRMLQSEKAIEERGFQKKRESKSGKDVNYSNQIKFLEYKKQNEKQIELLRTIDPSFNLYYKQKANDYFNKLNR